MNKPIIIASGPVIIENDKVLLNKHGDDGFWKFVGGRAERHDISLEEVAKREVMEEMGLEVDLIRPPGKARLSPVRISWNGSGLTSIICRKTQPQTSSP